MALPLPRLDRRTFDQLVAEGQVLLPRAAPAWTDYNAHDPGITLLELFAWLVESDFYRLDRVPGASQRAFLRLLGIELRPPEVAETVVLARAVQPGTLLDVPASSRVESAHAGVAFETTQPTTVGAMSLVAVATGSSVAPTDRTREHASSTRAFFALGSSPRVDDALYLGFERALSVTPFPFGLYLSTGSDEQDRATRALLRAETQACQEEAAKDAKTCPTSSAFDWRPHYGAQTVWEYYDGAGAWAPLSAVEDETRSLTLSGFVRFTLPAGAVHAAGGVTLSGASNRFFVRCRLVRGQYDCPPRICSVATDALRVRHDVDGGPARSIGVSNGRAAQTYPLGASPIVPGSTRLDVVPKSGTEPAWTEAPQWDRVGPHDRAFVVSHERGEIRFGDGRIGRVPVADAQLRVAFRCGGGTLGNVAPRSLTTLKTPAGAAIAVEQPCAAWGGTEEEEIEAAMGRAIASLTTPARAVTLEDFEGLVLAMPGVPIARTSAIADYHPDMPCLPALGNVTVVVVPHCPAARPEPSAALLRAVARYLERRRILTTELHVVGPCYAAVSVGARLHVAAGTDALQLADRARAALNQFFDPLSGGPDGTGWPIGRDVYRAEVMALLQDLPGVDFVDEVELQVGDEPSSSCGNASICRHGLVVSGTHTITIARGDRR